jgi:hypothetical protein
VNIFLKANKQFSESQAAVNLKVHPSTFRVTCGNQKSGTSSLKSITERAFTISKGFQRSKQKLHIGVPSEKESQEL